MMANQRSSEWAAVFFFAARVSIAARKDPMGSLAYKNGSSRIGMKGTEDIDTFDHIKAVTIGVAAEKN